MVRRAFHVVGVIPLLAACATALSGPRSAATGNLGSPELLVPQRVVAAIREAYPSGRIVAACQARLVPGSQQDWAVVIYEPERHLRILTAYRGEGAGPIARLEIQRHGAPAEHAGQQELRCLTTEEARQIDVSLQESEGVQGHLLPADGVDLFCHSDSEPAFDCYQIDVRTGRLRSVGGWVT